MNYLKISLYFKAFLSSIVYVFVYFSKNKSIIFDDLDFWNSSLRVVLYKSKFLQFIRMFAFFKEFRSLVLFRLEKNTGSFLRLLVPCQNSLEFITDNQMVANRLLIHHGYSTIIFAEKIGNYCQIWHNVTIGRAHNNGPRPRIGNNVKICTGAVVLGDIEIGDNVTIAANSTVVKSVPSNCLVAGNPAKVIKVYQV